jgi:NADP-dependent 3-hydroxy acid dehydrogenase YdfG
MARVLLTGCSSGIGRCAAELLHARGHEVVATARVLASLDDLDCALRLPLDVRRPESVAAALESAGLLDAVVCNAGVSLWAPVELASMEDIEWLLDTNVLGVIRVVRAVLPGCRMRRRGRIVVVSSTAARRVTPFIGCYAATKAAIEAFTESVRYEMSDFGVTATIVEPGPVATSMEANRRVLDAAGSEYAPLVGRITAQVHGLRDAALSAEEAGRYVVGAVEMPDPPLRIPVDAPAERRIRERLAMSDAEYERLVLAMLGG